MIRLHPLGRSEDGGSILLAAHPEAEAAGYELVVDRGLLDLVGVDDADVQIDETRSAPAQSPAPDAPPERILPEGPLEIDSPASALEAAQGLWLVRADESISDETLHDAVMANLHRWNVRIPQSILDDGWFVTKLGDRAWQISFRFLTRGRIHEAEWVLDTERARLDPENELADALGFWERRERKVRRRRGGRGRGRPASGGRSQAKKR